MVVSERVVDQVPAVVHRLLPQAAPIEVLGALRPGRSHNTWVVRSSLGRLTVKVAHGVRDGVLAARLAEHARLRTHGIAVPGLLAWGSVAEHLVAVTEYLPGLDAAEALEVHGDRGIAEAMRDAGAAIAQLHGVPVAGFGDPMTGLGTGPSRWSDVELVDDDTPRQGAGGEDAAVGGQGLPKYGSVWKVATNP